MFNVRMWDCTKPIAAKSLAKPPGTLIFSGEDGEAALEIVQTLITSVLAEDGVRFTAASVHEDDDNILTIVLNNADNSCRMVIVVTCLPNSDPS